MKLLFVILFLVVLLMVIKKLYKKKIKVRKHQKMILIEERPVEYSDLQHYINTRLLYERKKNVLEKIIGPELEFDTDIQEVVPDIIDYHLNVDNQNVHDSVVQQNIKNTFKNSSNTILTYPEVLQQILHYCENNTKVEKTLEKINKRNANISNLNCGETDVIVRTWASSDDNIKSQIILEILDCEDSNGSLYCPTGVVSRITSALHVNNPEKAPKTKELLNGEVMQKFGHYYYQYGDKTLSKTKTIDDYNGVYPRETIKELIEEWIDHV